MTTILEESFVIDKINLGFEESIQELLERGSESLISIYSNKKLIVIEDLTEIIQPDQLERISSELSSEVLRATNSDTIQICTILLYKNGKHIREKTLGEEWPNLKEMQKYIPAATEEDLKYTEIGSSTEYETNGSDAISVLEEFLFNNIQPNEYETISVSIYKLKK